MRTGRSARWSRAWCPLVALALIPSMGLATSVTAAEERALPPTTTLTVIEPGTRGAGLSHATAADDNSVVGVSNSPGNGDQDAVIAERADRAVRKPNIIFFLADDMATPLLRHMPNTRRLIFRGGATFKNFFTNISLCCPARVSLLTGKYAHNTGIIGNSYPDGFHGFHTSDERRRTVAVTLKRRAGYDTSLMGKYLNEYPFVDTRPRHGVRPTFVPNGWSDWAVPIRGQYAGVDYRLNLNGRLVHKEGPRDYLGDFLMRRALHQIGENRDRRGMAMFLSFYGPHAPEPASPIEKRNKALQRHIAGLRLPRTPDFNERNMGDKPPQMRRLPRIGPRAIRKLDRIYRRQVLSVTSIDRYVGMVVRKLRKTRQLRRTFLVFTSDNGLHLGAHRLVAGKNFPYATDVDVPFAIRGPGIQPGTTIRAVTGNIDVAPTFADMAGVSLGFPHDGESLLPLAQGRTPAVWRDYFYVAKGLPFGGRPERSTTEFRRPIERVAAAGRTTYRAVMSSRWQYIRYGNGAEELYDARSDPYQVRNVLARRPANRTDEELVAHENHRRALRRLAGCEGANACRAE